MIPWLLLSLVLQQICFTPFPALCLKVAPPPQLVFPWGWPGKRIHTRWRGGEKSNHVYPPSFLGASLSTITPTALQLL